MDYEKHLISEAKEDFQLIEGIFYYKGNTPPWLVELIKQGEGAVAEIGNSGQKVRLNKGRIEYVLGDE